MTLCHFGATRPKLGSADRRAQMSALGIYSMPAKRAKKAGIKNSGPDVCRTFISHLLDAGTDIAPVSKLAGHTHIQTTARDDRGPEERQQSYCTCHIRHKRQDDMSYESTTLERRKSVYAEGKQAFNERKDRGYNPHAASNLTLAVSWWHGWDTAEEESEGERSPLAKDIQMTQPGYDEQSETQYHKIKRRSMTAGSQATRKASVKVLHVP